MRFVFTVEVEVNRVTGKFARRDEIADQIREALEGADPGDYECEAEGQYETVDWLVNEEAEAPKPKRATPPTVARAPQVAEEQSAQGASGPTP